MLPYKDFEYIPAENADRLPRVLINGRELGIIAFAMHSYTINATNEMITTFKVSGYLAKATSELDAIGSDFNPACCDRCLEVRTFIYDTWTRNCLEITNPGGEMEAKLKRWSQSETHEEELLEMIRVARDS